jgi:hypothetical protein
MHPILKAILQHHFWSVPMLIDIVMIAAFGLMLMGAVVFVKKMSTHELVKDPKDQ